jgi:hypothetical protein
MPSEKNSFVHKLSDGTQEGVHLQGVQVWRPAIPYPLFVGFGLRKAKCECGRTFKSKQAYDEHYIYQAVWQNESGYIPKILAQAQKAGRLANELEHQEKKK